MLESGECVSSQLIPGITIPGTWEWKETRPYSPGKFGSFFGERGLLRKEPRATRIVCRTDVIACRIVAQERPSSEDPNPNPNPNRDPNPNPNSNRNPSPYP